MEGFPDAIEVCSDSKTIREYGSLFERILDRKLELRFRPLEELRKEYAAEPGAFPHDHVVKILMAEGAYDYTHGEDGAGKALLKPALGPDWKPRTAEDFLNQIRSRKLN